MSAGAVPDRADDDGCVDVACTHTLGTRLSARLALLTMLVLGVLSAVSWLSVTSMIEQRIVEDHTARTQLLAQVLALEARAGGEAAVLRRLHAEAPMRDTARLELRRADGSLFYADRAWSPSADARHMRAEPFVIEAPGLAGGRLTGMQTCDYTADAALGRRWAWTLLGVTLLAGLMVALLARWRVMRELRPLRTLAAQVRAIAPGRLDQRLALADPAEELMPFVLQFNALMERLERAYAQLEAFNADVAHELRTPLATLIGETELALSRERDTAALRDTLGSNLEEMQRLSAMINDMLFLAQADRGAVARRGEPVSLAALAGEVVEFHEAPLAEAGLTLAIEGDAQLAVDEPLFKRALSNLIGNATRFAERDSTIVVRIAPEPLAAAGGAAASAARAVQVVVQNRGEAIAREALPRLFDRFFRVDASRSCCDQQHHGLGLAIVAAIARMHAGRTLAESEAGATRVGFTLAAAP